MTDDECIARFIEVFGFTREKGLYYLGKYAKKKRISEADFARATLSGLAESTPRTMVNHLVRDGEIPPEGYEAALACAKALRSAAIHGGTVIEAYDRLVRKEAIDPLDVRLVQKGNDLSFVPVNKEESK